MPRVARTAKRIPTIGSPSITLEANDYSKGMNSYLGHDKFPLRNGESNMWRLAQDARMPTLGEYETRRGFDFHSDAAGETQDQAQTSTTGAADQNFGEVTRLAQKWTAGASGRLSKYEVRIKNSASATGTIIVEHWTDSGGSPGTLVARSSIAASTPTSSYAYTAARFADAPSVSSGTSYWIVAYIQSVGSGSYKWSSTTTATTAKTSSNSGTSWSAASFALNFKQYYATSDGVKGFIRATKSDGTKITIFAHGTSIYSVDNTTGALTALKTGLSASATLYRFWLVNDIVYYVNGYDGYRKLSGANFATEAQVNSTNYTDLLVHKGVMVLIRADDPTRFDISNFADYETFTSTDFFNVPAPKTGDPITNVQSLNGYLLIRTRNRCFIFSGEDNATFRLDDAPDQKGTYGPNTAVSDKSFTYFLSDDGVYKSNGSQPQLISQNVYSDVVSIANKDSACVAIRKGRLYLWYRSANSSFNDKCIVWNLNLTSDDETVESKDTNAYVASAVTSFRDSDEMLVASSLIGQIYWQELDSNDYTNLGGDINFALATHYMHFNSSAVLKGVRKWEPRFTAQSGNYTIDCDYAYDLRDNWQTYSQPSVQGSGAIWGSSSSIWGSFTWGTSAEISPQLYVPGDYKRIALRYKHYATRQPEKFLGHTLVVQARRIR